MSDNIAHALSGAGGGIISMILTYPLITVSSRLQVQKDPKEADSYKGGRDIIVKILKNEGIEGLYSGLSSAVFGIALTNGIYFYFYEGTKSIFEKNKRPMSVIENMIAGAIAGVATVLVSNPIWVVNTRMTTRKESLDENEKQRQKKLGNESLDENEKQKNEKQKQKKLGTIATILKIINEDGIKAFWQGVIPALILVINPIIQYTVFEQLKSRLERMRKLGNLDFFLLGAISKIIATATTYPYIVIKSRMQLRQSSYKNTWDGLQKIIANEGYGGLYKGIMSKLLQSVLTAAFLFMYKEALFKYTVAFLSSWKTKEISENYDLNPGQNI